MKKDLVLWFLKVNINSHIFEVYENPKKIKEINNMIRKYIKNGIEYKKVEIQKFEIDGVEKETEVEITYKFATIELLDETRNKSIYGSIIKSHKLYGGKVDVETGDKIIKTLENDEKIMFYYDISHEIITFHRTYRFGEKQFLEAFQKLLNMSFIGKEEEVYFEISFLKKGLNLSDIVLELKKLGKIEELKIKVIPPNPTSKFLEELQKDGEKKLKEFEEGKITEKSIIFKSSTESGLKIDSKMLKKELEASTAIHSKLTEEEALDKGYVEITAENKSGKKLSTKGSDMKAIKIHLSLFDKTKFNFINICKEKIESLLT